MRDVRPFFLFIKKRIQSLLKDEKGNVMVLVAVSMTALIAVTGLVGDMGMVYLEQSNLKKEATTAALSGAQELVNTDPTQLSQDEQRVRDVVSNVLASYHDGSTLTELQINMNHSVTVGLEKSVPFSFAKIFSSNQATVQEVAGAGIVPISRATGVVPLGIDESLPVTYGQDVTLKVGPGDSTQGNFGILALEGTGASVYQQTFEHGTTNAISVGETYSVKPGNVEGPTSKAVQYRMDTSPYSDDGTYHLNDPRVMTVVVYKSLSSKEIQVTGFAYVYLLPPGNDPSVVRCRFIKLVSNGSIGQTGVDRGAYTVKLLK